MKIALIGLGYWGRNYLKIIDSIDSLELAAIVEPSQDLILNKKLSIKYVYKSIEELLSNNLELDAAIVSSPSSTHYEITKKLISTGIHVLVEKPIALSLKQTKELYKIANDKKVVLLVDHIFLYNRSINYVSEIINREEFGKILHISFERTNLGPIRKDTSCLWDLTTHDISILNSFINFEPSTINTSGFSTNDQTNFDIVNISLQYKEKLFVTMFSSWLHPEKTRKIKIVGENQMIVVDDLNTLEPVKIYYKKFNQIYEKYDNSNNSIFSFTIGNIVSPYIELKEPLKEVVLDFINRINNDKSEFSQNSKELTIRTVGLLEKINLKLIK